MNVWVPLLPMNKQISCLLSDRSIGNYGCRHPDARCHQVGLRHVIAGDAVVAVPEGNFLMAEIILVINPADREGERSGSWRQQVPLTVVARSSHHADACLNQCGHRFIYGVFAECRNWIPAHREADYSDSEPGTVFQNPHQCSVNTGAGDVPVGITYLNEHQLGCMGQARVETVTQKAIAGGHRAGHRAVPLPIPSTIPVGPIRRLLRLEVEYRHGILCGVSPDTNAISRLD